MPNPNQSQSPNQMKNERSDKQIIHLDRRTYNVFDFEVQTRDDGKPRRIIGHAAVFNVVDGPSWFRERIEPGAFMDSIKVDDIRALFNHNPDYILGRTSSGTLRLNEDDKGLWMEIDPPDTSVGRDLMVSIQRGDITQASFAFQTVDAGWETEGEDDIRVLKKVRLFDVSPVTYPFYEATDVSLRSRIGRDEIQRAMKQRRMRLALLRKT